MGRSLGRCVHNRQTVCQYVIAFVWTIYEHTVSYSVPTMFGIAVAYLSMCYDHFTVVPSGIMKAKGFTKPQRITKAVWASLHSIKTQYCMTPTNGWLEEMWRVVRQLVLGRWNHDIYDDMMNTRGGSSYTPMASCASIRKTLVNTLLISLKIRMASVIQLLPILYHSISAILSQTARLTIFS